MTVVCSYSFLSAWDTCRHRAYRQYIVRDLPKTPDTPEQKWGNDVHYAFENRIRSGTLLPINMPWEHIAEPLVRYGAVPEQKLGMTREGSSCDFFAKNVFLRGKLDAPIVAGEYAFLPDFKTGKVREEPFELEIGACLLQAKYPQVRKITGRYAWLREGRLGREHDCSNTLQTWNLVNAKMREVEEEREFPKTPGPLCGWCSVRDCEHNRSKQ